MWWSERGARLKRQGIRCIMRSAVLFLQKRLSRGLTGTGGRDEWAEAHFLFASKMRFGTAFSERCGFVRWQ